MLDFYINFINDLNPGRESAESLHIRITYSSNHSFLAKIFDRIAKRNAADAGQYNCYS